MSFGAVYSGCAPHACATYLGLRFSMRSTTIFCKDSLSVAASCSELALPILERDGCVCQSFANCAIMISLSILVSGSRGFTYSSHRLRWRVSCHRPCLRYSNKSLTPVSPIVIFKRCTAPFVIDLVCPWSDSPLRSVETPVAKRPMEATAREPPRSTMLAMVPPCRMFNRFLSLLVGLGYNLGCLGCLPYRVVFLNIELEIYLSFYSVGDAELYIVGKGPILEKGSSHMLAKESTAGQ